MTEYNRALERLRAAQGEEGTEDRGTAMFGKRKYLSEDDPHTYDRYDELRPEYEAAGRLGPLWNPSHTKMMQPRRPLSDPEREFSAGYPKVKEDGDLTGHGTHTFHEAVKDLPYVRTTADKEEFDDGGRNRYRTSADLVPITKEEFDGKPPRAYEEEWPPASWDGYEPEGRWLYDERRYEGDPKSRTAYEYGIPEATTKYRAAMERAHLGKHPRRYNPYSGEDYDDYYADLPDYSYEAKHGINPLDNEERLRNNGSRINDGRFHRDNHK